jgi:peptidoglycan hydrolase CwlO-like protein
MNNTRLERDIDYAKSEMNNVIDTLVSEVEEAESRIKELEDENNKLLQENEELEEKIESQQIIIDELNGRLNEK